MKHDLKRLGKFLKLERVRNDLSQEKLAELTGVSTRTISLIESGQQHPKLFLVMKLANILGFNLDALSKELQ